MKFSFLQFKAVEFVLAEKCRLISCFQMALLKKFSDMAQLAGQLFLNSAISGSNLSNIQAVITALHRKDETRTIEVGIARFLSSSSFLNDSRAMVISVS